jgi:hypothetical protein
MDNKESGFPHVDVDLIGNLISIINLKVWAEYRAQSKSTRSADTQCADTLIKTFGLFCHDRTEVRGLSQSCNDSNRLARIREA